MKLNEQSYWLCLACETKIYKDYWVDTCPVCKGKNLIKSETNKDTGGKEKMIIGTDINLKECEDAGYTMAKYDGRKPFTLDTEIEFFKYLLGVKYWTRMTTRELWDIYQDHKSSIQSFSDYNVEDINQLTTYWDALELADIIDAYLGIMAP